MASATPASELRYRSAPSRRRRIQELVQEQGYCTTAELAVAFDVSEMTIRRDVARLVAEGAVRDVHGGASVVGPQELRGADYGLRRQSVPTVKNAIARRALELLPEHGAIAIDSGSTAFEFASCLPTGRRLQVVTHSLPALTALAENEDIEVVSLGGTLQHISQSFAGPMTLAALAEMRVSTFFLAASGITERGVYCGSDFDAVTKRALMNVADEVVLLTDSTKFATTAMVRTCTLDAVSRVVVDDGITDEWKDRFAAAGVRVLTVAAPH